MTSGSMTQSSKQSYQVQWPWTAQIYAEKAATKKFVWIHPLESSQQNSVPGLNFSGTFLRVWTQDFSDLLLPRVCWYLANVIVHTKGSCHFPAIWCLYVWNCCSKRLDSTLGQGTAVWVKVFGIAVQELRIDQNSKQTILFVLPLKQWLRCLLNFNWRMPSHWALCDQVSGIQLHQSCRTEDFPYFFAL